MSNEQAAQNQVEKQPVAQLQEERGSVMTNGHGVLRENANLLKSALMKQNTFNEFIVGIEQRLVKASLIDEQARLLAILFEVNVQDTTRIGESLVETLRHDLETKASGEFEFIAGDKNLATALLNLLNEDGEVTNLIEELCAAQTQAGVATPFDYRRLTLGFDGAFDEAEVADWIEYFQETPVESLKGFVEIGRSFASTRPARYSKEQEEILGECLSARRNLLDIGGSIGVSARHMMDRFRIPRATVTDIRTEGELQDAFYGELKKDSQIDYILGEQGDIVTRSPDEKEYDLVTANNVLVHVIEKEKALNNIIPRVADGGLLVVSDGYNANPPRISFWIFQRRGGRIE